MRYKGTLIIAATTLLGLSLAACGHGSIVNPPHGKVTVAPVITSSSTTSSQASFNNNTITTSDLQIKILSMQIVKPGVSTNNKSLLRVGFAMTNKTNKQLKPDMIKQYLNVYQKIDNDNQKLNTGITLHKDKQLVAQQNNNISKNNSTDGVITFVLKNTVNPVELVAKEHNQQIGSQTIQLGQLPRISNLNPTSALTTDTTSSNETNDTTTVAQHATASNTTTIQQ